MQEALIIARYNENDTAPLNALLKQGYRVVHSCPMPSCGINEIRPTCLVIVEKSE